MEVLLTYRGVKMEDLKGIGAIVKVFKILGCFSFEEEEHGISSFAQTLKMPKSTVSRLVMALETYGYLEHNPLTKKYKLGYTLFYLGSIVQRQMRIREKALSIMYELRDKTGESVQLNVIRENERMCLEYLEGGHDLKTFVHVGQRSPLHAGASAKVLLAYLDEEKIEEIINQNKLEQITENTITDPQKLKGELAEIRRRGYAYSVSERILGAVSVSAPLKDYTGRVIGGISISFPEVRATEEKVDHIVALVKQAAKQVSFQLGYDAKLDI